MILDPTFFSYQTMIEKIIGEKNSFLYNRAAFVIITWVISNEKKRNKTNGKR